MELAAAMKVHCLFEQPVHEATGGMESHAAFKHMSTLFPAPCCTFSFDLGKTLGECS